MLILKSALCGIIQGLTEFLPVSSSGHLALFNNIFGFIVDDGIFFTLVLHLGTLAAVVIAYFKEIKNLFFGFFSLIAKIFTGRFKYKNLAPYERFVILIFIATVPLVIGAFIDNQIEFLTSSSLLIGIFLIVNAGVLFFSDKIVAGNITEENALPKNAIAVGLSQLIGVLPGISRSGSTITGGLLTGYKRGFAVKFSFIMSIPAILGASVFKAADIAESGAVFTGDMIVSCIIGFVFAFIFGYAAIFLLRIISEKKRFYIFSVWCLIVGTAAVISSLMPA
jgi:undecaprenyl-diphosphatase